jgi:hypothetical protein
LHCIVSHCVAAQLIATQRNTIQNYAIERNSTDLLSGARKEASKQARKCTIEQVNKQGDKMESYQTAGLS